MTEISLYNMSDGKTKAVFGYVKELKQKTHWNAQQRERFLKIKKRALEAPRPDEALDIIGYIGYDIEPKIYLDVI